MSKPQSMTADKGSCSNGHNEARYFSSISNHRDDGGVERIPRHHRRRFHLRSGNDGAARDDLSMGG